MTAAPADIAGLLGDRPTVSLAEADRLLSRAGCAYPGGAISRMLKAAGYAKDGWDGTGYDRSPRYRKVGR